MKSEKSTDKNVTMTDSYASARNYHNWVFQSFVKYLLSDGLTLEIGAGHGEFTELLSNISNKVIATDINRESIVRIKNKLSNISNLEVILMDGIDKKILQKPVDNLIAINIIEHIKDDNAFIRDCFSVLNKDGILVVFAPAFPLLFSNIDKQAGHFRRYNKKNLENILITNGFQLTFSHYFNFIGFWGWFINKIVGSGVNSEVTNIQVTVFNKIIRMIKWFEVFSFFCGQSVLVVGQKN